MRGTFNKCLHFGCSTNNLQGYVDLDCVGDIDTRWSTIGYVFTVGGAAVRWVSKLQNINALSTTEAAKEMI